VVIAGAAPEPAVAAAVLIAGTAVVTVVNVAVKAAVVMVGAMIPGEPAVADAMGIVVVAEAKSTAEEVIAAVSPGTTAGAGCSFTGAPRLPDASR
jgi:regulator of RNase E activity RraA